MYSSTKELILSLLKEKKEIRPHELIQTLSLTPAAIHRHLVKLTQDGRIEKIGKAPLVYYRLKEQKIIYAPNTILHADEIQTIEDNYLYISPQGKFLKGMEGFYTWAKQTKQDKNFEKLAHAYLAILKTAKNLDYAVIGKEKGFEIIKQN
ncbi:winged helix-turn-helix transcriptional regulator [bacterium]|nr:winged helix-turn-helix transcriptional regulator [bacterium]